MLPLVRNWHSAHTSVLVVSVLSLPDTFAIMCHIGLRNIPHYFCIVSCRVVELLLRNSKFQFERNCSLKTMACLRAQVYPCSWLLRKLL